MVLGAGSGVFSSPAHMRLSGLIFPHPWQHKPACCYRVVPPGTIQPGGNPGPSRPRLPDQTFMMNFVSELLNWFRVHRADLPWRQDRDPYRVWLAEIMLQQTQVGTVIG